MPSEAISRKDALSLFTFRKNVPSQLERSPLSNSLAIPLRSIVQSVQGTYDQFSRAQRLTHVHWPGGRRRQCRSPCQDGQQRQGIVCHSPEGRVRTRPVDCVAPFEKIPTLPARRALPQALYVRAELTTIDQRPPGHMSPEKRILREICGLEIRTWAGRRRCKGR
jgi:hypothetical protein